MLRSGRPMPKLMCHSQNLTGSCRDCLLLGDPRAETGRSMFEECCSSPLGRER